MLRYRSAIFVVAVLLLVGGCGKQPDYGYAPQFTLPDLNGVSVSLSDFKGKVLIIDFWTTWCPGCVAEIPHFIELQEEYEEQGFEIITIILKIDQFQVSDVILDAPAHLPANPAESLPLIAEFWQRPQQKIHTRRVIH